MTLIAVFRRMDVVVPGEISGIADSTDGSAAAMRASSDGVGVCGVCGSGCCCCSGSGSGSGSGSCSCSGSGSGSGLGSGSGSISCSSSG